jgi:hypothetical protein
MLLKVRYVSELHVVVVGLQCSLHGRLTLLHAVADVHVRRFNDDG